MKRRLVERLNAVRKRFIARRRHVRRVSVASLRGKLIIIRSSVEWRWQLNTVRRVRVIKRWSIDSKGERTDADHLNSTNCLLGYTSKTSTFLLQIFLNQTTNLHYNFRILTQTLVVTKRFWTFQNLRSHVSPSLQPQEGVIRYCY